MNMLAIDFGQEFSTRTGHSTRQSSRRISMRHTCRSEPCTLPLFPLEPAGPVTPPERHEEDCERWDGLS
ncbi:MAG: hypothetical protein ABSH20_12090 [Tepidisphaeraceae bacterium]|jgi:hypothetical protein